MRGRAAAGGPRAARRLGALALCAVMATAGLLLTPRPATADGQVVPTQRISDVRCRDGMAGPFPCDGIDLLSFVPLGEFDEVYVDPDVEPRLTDLWGWVDRQSGDEYVLVGKTSAVAMFRVTDPTDPVYLGDLINPSPSQWALMDIKVHEDHAFVVSESEGFGMQVFDLTRLRGVEQPRSWGQDAHYAGVYSSHNLALDPSTGYAYIVGGNIYAVGPAYVYYGPDQCGGGLHMVDVRVPLLPVFAGCWSGDGYVHDAQCVVYGGPDVAHVGHEVCFLSAEDRVTIVDVTDKRSPKRLGQLTYPHTGYTHQGWLTGDQRHFVFGDEFDERDHGLRTRTLIADVSDLERPRLLGEHLASTTSMDHNQFIHDGLVHQSNFTAGYRLLATDDIAEGRLHEVGYLDTYPADDHVGWGAGSWGNYPFLPSGTVAVTSQEEGLFLVRPSRAPVRRLAGPDRIATAAAVSAATFPAPTDTVVIASATSYPDALAGAPLAGSLDAPVLLSGSQQLTGPTAAEVRRLDARRAFLLGGTGVLGDDVEAELLAAGVEEVIRLGGADRFETAGRVADVLMEGASDAVYVVEGVDADPSRGWPDAVSVSGLAAFEHNPVLLVDTDLLPRATRDRLRSLSASVDRAVIVGGPGAVSTSVEEQIRSLGFTVERLAGADRYATSGAVARAAQEAGADPARTWLATGDAFADALAAGPAAAAAGGVLHLVAGSGLDPSTSNWVDDHACELRLLTLVGGPGAIAPAVQADLQQVLDRASCASS